MFNQKIPALVCVLILFASQTKVLELLHFDQDDSAAHTFCLEHNQIEHTQAAKQTEDTDNHQDDKLLTYGNYSTPSQENNASVHTACLALNSPVQALKGQNICFIESITLNLKTLYSYSNLAHHAISIIRLSPALSPPTIL